MYQWGKKAGSQSVKEVKQAEALLKKGMMLSELDRRIEAIAAYDELLARFGLYTALPLAETIATALYDKASNLALLARSDEAISTYDELLARFSGAMDLPLQ